jgi:alpha-1,3-rhamnosyl/mannosyltransferase
MQIIVNAIPLLSKLTGVGVYTLKISQKLLELYPENQYTFYYGYTSNKLITYSNTKQGRILSLVKKLFKKIPCGRSLIRSVKNRIKLKNLDIYFEPNFIPYLNVRARATLTTIHDFSFTVREWIPKDRYEFFNENFFKEIYKSHIIISPSEFIKKEVLDKLTFPEERVVTIHHGIDHAVFNQNHTDYAGQNSLRGNIKKLGNYLLFVGALQPRKNVKGLIQAYTSLPGSFQKDFQLLLVGYEGWNHGDISEMIATNKNIHIYDSIENNNELAELYRRASLFVFPSFYEGFGFPPLEAMACGCPVVASNTSSIPEICGDAAYYIDPHNVESIANGILRVTEDENLRKKLIQKGLERVKLFTWETSAQKHREVFESVLGL